MPDFTVNVLQTLRIQREAPLIVTAGSEEEAYEEASQADAPKSGWKITHSSLENETYDVVEEIKVTPETPISDQPDHPLYGPVRRLDIMLRQITADRGFDAFEASFVSRFGKDWSYVFVDLLKDYGEAKAQRYLLGYARDIL